MNNVNNHNQHSTCNSAIFIPVFNIVLIVVMMVCFEEIYKKALEELK